ncbi:MAG: protein O-GlcNAcase [Candidatus Limnocylindrales bacterium]
MSTKRFEVRGAIEGFYGHPWSYAQRLEMIDFLGARGMNVFVYSPKDDPLLRERWRTHDGEAALGRLGELVRRCKANGMELMWCISPGLSIRYSDPGDLAILMARIGRVLPLGVTHIGLFFDDIPEQLQFPEDEAAFADLLEAQIALCGQVLEALPDEVQLTVCPTEYWGRGTEPSLARLGAGLDRRVGLLWTGRAICSATLDLDDAQAFERTAGRRPTYWDNYPVNDVAMGYELHIGPYRGRDPQLWQATRGIIANAMELFEASKIPLATIADYLGDPEGYEPEASWRAAMLDVVGAADLDAFATFADNVRSSCLEAGDAPTVDGQLSRALFELEHGDRDRGVERLRALAAGQLGAAEHLLRGPVANQALVAEIRPWLAAYEIGAQAIGRIADLAAAGRLDEDGPAELAPFLIRLRRARVRVFGDALEMTLSVLSGTMFRPGEVP